MPVKLIKKTGLTCRQTQGVITICSLNKFTKFLQQALNKIYTHPGLIKGYLKRYYFGPCRNHDKFDLKVYFICAF